MNKPIDDSDIEAEVAAIVRHSEQLIGLYIERHRAAFDVPDQVLNLAARADASRQLVRIAALVVAPHMPDRASLAKTLAWLADLALHVVAPVPGVVLPPPPLFVVAMGSSPLTMGAQDAQEEPPAPAPASKKTDSTLN